MQHRGRPRGTRLWQRITSLREIALASIRASRRSARTAMLDGLAAAAGARLCCPRPPYSCRPAALRLYLSAPGRARMVAQGLSGAPPAIAAEGRSRLVDFPEGRALVDLKRCAAVVLWCFPACWTRRGCPAARRAVTWLAWGPGARSLPAELQRTQPQMPVRAVLRTHACLPALSHPPAAACAPLQVVPHAGIPGRRRGAGVQVRPAGQGGGGPHAAGQVSPCRLDHLPWGRVL
jgi:hypothetical protein